MKTLQEKINKFFKTGEAGVALWNRYVKICKPNFSSANFNSADFSSANFRYANFHSADFRSADFRSANFRYANFRSANFRYANFSPADFRSADFRSANFRYANFSYADFRYANFNIIINEHTIGLTLECPEKGSFTCFKKASGYIVELQIPEKALRSSATSKKCRGEGCKTISITNIDGTDSGLTEIKTSRRDSNVVYKIGETMWCEDFDKNRWNECSTGFHFFMSRKMAECYN